MTAELRRVQALNAELLAALKAVQEDDLSINLKFSVQSAVDAAIAKAAAKEGA